MSEPTDDLAGILLPRVREALVELGHCVADVPPKTNLANLVVLQPGEHVVSYDLDDFGEHCSVPHVVLRSYTP